ncbi:MAG: hypothetical protein LBE20_01720 [Deltaproteobacteria bacterium]|jgi:hypothetical protein|nr:hypothetical protein [Deltaproteobacteria bacterium]
MKYCRIVIYLVWACCLITPTFASERDCQETSALLELTSKLRRLAVVKEVPCKLQNIIEVENYLKKQIQNKGILKQIQYEETVFKMIGIIPEDYSYTQGLINMYTSQLAGYYDKDNKFYAMADWISPSMQLPITVHELVHSLQDQHYNLHKILEEEPITTDEMLARLALAEGDASAVMYDYLNKKRGLPSLAEQNNISSFALSNMLGAIISTNTVAAPKALQVLLVYPYISGLSFVHMLLLQNGYQAVDAAYLNLPRSTQEILHPEKYLSRINNPRQLATALNSQLQESIPRLLNQKYRLPSVYSDTLGEFMISSLLNNFLSPIVASQASIGWKYDRLDLYQLQENPKKFLLAWTIIMENPDDAEVLFNSLLKVYSERFYQNLRKNKDTLYFKNNITNTVGYLVRESPTRVRIEITS